MLANIRVVTDARAVLSSLTLSVDETDWKRWCAEYGELEKMLDRRYAECASLFAPIDWRIERQTGLLLYVLIKRCRPRIMVEAGVANGHSTVISLSALQANACGELHSFDISNSVGSLLRDVERARWTLHVCSPQSAGIGFRHLVNELGPVDLFFHDSDHSYIGQ
ncbi:MAG: class I SAM-dependent methyltransferase, partial [Candidatus Dormibacteria bacterium]